MMEYLADAEMDEVEQYRIDRYFFILVFILFRSYLYFAFFAKFYIFKGVINAVNLVIFLGIAGVDLG